MQCPIQTDQTYLKQTQNNRDLLWPPSADLSPSDWVLQHTALCCQLALERGNENAFEGFKSQQWPTSESIHNRERSDDIKKTKFLKI